MKLTEGMRKAVFLKRKNRFSCLVRLSGREETVYLPNSGRLETILFPGQKVYLVDRASPSRRTRYDLVMTDLGGILVSVDSRVPGDVIYEALCNRALPQFIDYSSIRREVVYGNSRLDFCLSRGEVLCFLEIKSVILVEERIAHFPDAPTARGRRHLESLIQAKSEGYGATVIFVIQREDVDCFSPNDRIDPDFGTALRRAKRLGVDIYAYCCSVTRDKIELDRLVPVDLGDL